MGNNVKKNNSEAKAGSSSLEKSRLVTQIKPSNQLGNAENRSSRYRTSPSQTEFVTLKLTYVGIKNSQQNLPLLFLAKNRITEPGLITILGKDGSKTMVRLLRESTGRMKLGKGWREFVLANGLKIGESFTLEAVWEDNTLMLKLSTMDSKNDKNKIEKESTPSSEINHRVMTLKLTHDVLWASTLILSVPFMRANCIEKLGKIGFVGQDNTVCWGCLLSRTGIVAVGIGWGEFCESNGVKEGDLFNLEFVPHDQNTFPVLKLYPHVGD